METNGTPAEAGTGGSLTFDEGVSALERLFTGTPRHDEAKDQNPADEADGTPETEPEADESGEVETEETDAEQSEPDAKPEPATAADDALVTLDDGSQVTVKELRRSFLRESDYTKKTTAVKAERDELESQRQQLLERAQAIIAQRDLILEIQQKNIPEMPDSSMLDADPIGYWQQRTAHEEAVAKFQSLKQAKEREAALMAQEMQAQKQQAVARERELLLQKRPELKDPEKLKTVASEMADVLNREYGLSPEDYQELADHRAIEVLLDAVAYRKLKAAKPSVQVKLENKPPVLKPTKRVDAVSQGKAAFAEKKAAFKKTGSREALVEVLKSFDL